MHVPLASATCVLLKLKGREPKLFCNACAALTEGKESKVIAMQPKGNGTKVIATHVLL